MLPDDAPYLTTLPHLVQVSPNLVGRRIDGARHERSPPRYARPTRPQDALLGTDARLRHHQVDRASHEGRARDRRLGVMGVAEPESDIRATERFDAADRYQGSVTPNALKARLASGKQVARYDRAHCRALAIYAVPDSLP